MKLRHLLLIIPILLTAIQMSGGPAPIQADTSPTAAVLMTCSGAVTVMRGSGNEEAGSFGLHLQTGDKVKTGADGSAEIMLEDGTWLQIGPNSGMQIKNRGGSKPAEQPAAEKNFEVVQNFLKLKNSEGTSSISGLRSGNKKNELVALSPCQTKIREGRPTFRWKIADQSTELRLTVYNESGVHWQHDTKDATSVDYPADAPALTPGTSYSWTLETTDPLAFPPLRSKAVFFEVISPKEADMLSEALSAIAEEKTPSKSAYHLMRASLFFDQGLLEDAIAETQTALTTDPENASLHSILARLYSEVGRTEDAITEYGRIVGKE